MSKVSNQKFPLVTVAIATYNSRRTIEKCLQSIKSQTYPNIEIVVVDGLRYDPEEQKKCQKIIEKYARYYQDGPERSIQRNRGIKEAKGEFVYVIDQDMYLTPDVVKECVEMMMTQQFSALIIPEISIGEGFWTKVVALERYVTTYLELGPNEYCRFFRKKDGLAVGGYDPSIVGAEDADFQSKMAGIGKVGKTKNHIWHDEGRTEFWDRVKKKYYYSRSFRKYLQKRPAAASSQFFPIKPAYFKHWQEFAKQPLVGIGVVVLRTCEVAAGALGLLFNT